MRYDLAGTSYRTSTVSVGSSSGCPEGGGCRGYELMQDLDFDVDGDGGTWSGSGDEGYTLDSDDHQADYFPVDGGGWLPIGNARSPFAAVFDGNSHTISNLAIRRELTNIGLFAVISGGAAAIRSLGLIDNLAHNPGTDSTAGGGNIGGLAGLQRGGSITASYATGAAAGGGGGNNSVGGLVGLLQDGSITASYARGAAVGGAGSSDSVGGLVGLQFAGSITASYATGAAAGGAGSSDSVGGLVGGQDGGPITASYATGAAAGGAGMSDRVGGLVGRQDSGSITESYGFGALDGEETETVGLHPTLKSAVELTEPDSGFETAAGTSWNAPESNTLGAWDFGTAEQIPALKYADYDGVGDVFSCGSNLGFPANVCGTLLPGPG